MQNLDPLSTAPTTPSKIENFSLDFSQTNSLNTHDIATLICECFNKPPWNEKWTADSARGYLEQLINSGGDFIVGKDLNNAEKIVALGIGRKLDGINGKFDSDLFNSYQSCYHIHAIMVSDRARGKGIAKNLVSMLIKKGEELGVDFISTRTRSDNYPMLSIFRNFSLNFYGAEELENGGTKHISCIFGRPIIKIPTQIQPLESHDLPHSFRPAALTSPSSIPEKSLYTLRDAFCNRDPAQLASIIGAQATLYSPGTTVGTIHELHGREAIVGFFRDKVFPRFPKVDFKLSKESLASNGSTNLAVEWESFLSTDSGQDYSNRGAWFITTDPSSGEIIKLVEYFDTEMTKANLERYASFYDFTAPIYHEIYQGKWPEIIKAQANYLDKLIKEHLNLADNKKARILDSACGVGTQTIGLSMLGHQIIGIDLSDKSINQAEQHAKSFNSNARFKIGNMLKLSEIEEENNFDAILSCDNALRHLADESEVRSYVNEMLRTLRDGGITLITLRDLELERNEILSKGASCSFKPYSASLTPDNSAKAFFQLGRFKGPYYEFDFFVAEKNESGTRAVSMPLKLLAITADKVSEIMRDCGFSSVVRNNSVKEFYGHDIIIGIK